MSEAVENQGIETGQDTELEIKDLEDTGSEELETQEEESTEEQIQDNGEFKADDLEFDEEVPTKFGDYDLSKYKGVINFENEEFTNSLNSKAQEFKELGFTQAQVEYLIDKEIEYAKQQQESKALNKEKVMAELQNSLTPQEKRDYKAVGNYTKEIIKGDAQLEKCYDEAMANPIVYKLLHKAFNKSLGGVNLGVKTNVEVKENKLSFESALDEYTERLKVGKAEYKDLLEKMSKEDIQKFKDFLGL